MKCKGIVFIIFFGYFVHYTSWNTISTLVFFCCCCCLLVRLFFWQGTLPILFVPWGCLFELPSIVQQKLRFKRFLLIFSITAYVFYSLSYVIFAYSQIPTKINFSSLYISLWWPTLLSRLQMHGFSSLYLLYFKRQ